MYFITWRSYIYNKRDYKDKFFYVGESAIVFVLFFFIAAYDQQLPVCFDFDHLFHYFFSLTNQIITYIYSTKLSTEICGEYSLVLLFLCMRTQSCNAGNVFVCDKKTPLGLWGYVVSKDPADTHVKESLPLRTRRICWSTLHKNSIKKAYIMVFCSLPKHAIVYS